MDRIQRILWPTDFSEQARRAVPWVNGTAQRFDASVEIVHVLVPSLAMASMTGHAAAAATAYLEEVQRHATETLDEIARQDIASGVDTTTAVVTGSPAREIARVAEQDDVDLIIIATHGETGLVRLVTGSVAEKVVRIAPCPVLSVPPPAETD